MNKRKINSFSKRFIVRGLGHLRTFARKFYNIDFFLNLLPLKVDELVMEGHRLRLGENMPRRTPKSE